MTAAATDKLQKVGIATATTLDAPGYTIGATSVTVVSTTGWPTTTGITFATDEIDATGAQVANSYNEYVGVVSSATSITSVSHVNGTDRNYTAGTTTRVYIPVSEERENRIVDWGLVDHTQLGKHKTLTDANGNEWIEQGSTAAAVNQVKITNAATATPPKIAVNGDDTNVSLLIDGKGTGLAIPRFASPQGYLVNGKISRTVASNNLTVAIKTLAGNDPSANDPVYIRIGDTVRTLTAALSVTKNAATNWFSKGAGYFATNESDFFVYLCWNTTDTAVTISFSSIPSGRTYADFSTTTTVWNYWAGSGSAPGSTDEVEVIGRFNATLSATAAFNWSVPATSIVINRPIFDTRKLSATNTGSAGGTIYWKQTGTEKTAWGFTSNQTIGGAAPASASLDVTLPAGFFSNLESVTVSAGPPQTGTQYNFVNTSAQSTTTISINYSIINGSAGVFNAQLRVIGT